MSMFGLNEKIENTKAAVGTAQKVGRVTTHLQTNRTAYLAASGGLLVGLLIGQAIARSRTPYMNVINVVKAV